MRPRLIAHGAAEPKDTDAFMDINLVFNASASFRRDFFVFSVMVSMYVQYRYGGKSYQKRKIARIQIAAGNNQVDAFQLALLEKIP